MLKTLTAAKPPVNPLPALGWATAVPPRRREINWRTASGRFSQLGRTAVEAYGGLSVMASDIPPG